MKAAEITLMLNSMSRWMMQNDIDKLCTLFDTPLPFYANGVLSLMRDGDALARYLCDHRALALSENVLRFHPVILEIEDSSADKALVLVRWEHEKSDPHKNSSSIVRYVLRAGNAAQLPKIELVEYIYSQYVDLLAAPRRGQALAQT